MADQLNMGGLSLDNHQPNGMGGGRSAYIPPHMRGMPPPVNMDGPSPQMMNGSVHPNGAWGGPPR